MALLPTKEEKDLKHTLIQYHTMKSVNRKIVLSLLILIMGLPLAQAQEELGGPQSLDACLTYALEHNQNVQAAEIDKRSLNQTLAASDQTVCRSSMQMPTFQTTSSFRKSLCLQMHLVVLVAAPMRP